jgi:hypothetical protein
MPLERAAALPADYTLATHLSPLSTNLVVDRRSL